MADVYLEVPVTTDAPTLADAAIAALQAQWPDWEPNDGNLEVVIIEAIAQMAADAAETASQVPSTIFNAFGQAFAGITRNSGSYASTTVDIGISDSLGITIPAATEVEIDGYVFATDLEFIVPPGSATASDVAVTATVIGEEANGLTGSTSSMISAIARVSGVGVLATTSGGTDEETDEEYLDRLSTQMELQATTLVTTHDFELLALSVPSVYRSVATHLGARNVRFVGIDEAGANLAAGVKTDLGTLFAQYRMVNTTVTIEDPTRTTVNVAYTVHLYPGYDQATVDAEIDAMLAELLSPLNWGAPTAPIPIDSDLGARKWYNEPKVRAYKVLDKVGNVAGVDYVTSLFLSANGRTGVTSVASTDVITLANHGFVNNQPIRFSALTGGAGMAINTTYYVIYIDANTFKLSATAGPGGVLDHTTNITAATIAPFIDASGDLTLPGNTPLPQPGTMTGTYV
jgi:uncharacterized phage protein gp47/JayE